MQQCCIYSVCMTYEHILEKIRTCGGRISPVRSVIIRNLLSQDCLISYDDILIDLKKHKLTPNRSTIFRELRFLVHHNIIHKHMISDDAYYEIPRDHHHHLICLACEKITKILMHDHLVCESAKIAHKNQFVITGHSVEFYGYCTHCRT